MHAIMHGGNSIVASGGFETVWAKSWIYFRGNTAPVPAVRVRCMFMRPKLQAWMRLYLSD